MAWFECVAVGENFLLRAEDAPDGPVLVGFEAVRVVEADDAEAAELAALALLQADNPFEPPLDPDAEPQAVVVFDQIKPIDAPPGALPGGFMFFPMDDVFTDGQGAG